MLDMTLNVLLIEDEDDHFQLIKRSLSRAAQESVRLHRVARLQDGLAALDGNVEFDAILTDLNLPDSRGVATFRTIRRHAGAIPAIVMTSQNVPKDGIALMRERADDFLPKNRLDGELILRSLICAVERRKLLDVETELYRREGELEAAFHIQQSLLPDCPPEISGLELAANSHQAEAVGGDYYDFLPLPSGNLLVVIGDACGHGPGAALVMAQAAASLRTLCDIYDDPATIMTRLNNVLVDMTPDYSFMTMVLMKFDLASGVLTWCNAGHPPPLVINHDGTERGRLTPDSNGVIVGVVNRNEYEVSGQLSLKRNDVILAITDGLSESRNADRRLLGLERIEERFHHVKTEPATRIIEELSQLAADWRGDVRADDDETAVVIRWNRP